MDLQFFIQLVISQVGEDKAKEILEQVKTLMEKMNYEL